MTITIQFLGAARQVTGSKHLLTVNDKQVLLDCGMVQGPRRLANKLNTHLPLLPKKVDAVVLSHAHIDHSGSLPRLVKLGFRGKIHCTYGTRDLCEILLVDSAHIQTSDARYLRKKGRDFEPAYEFADVEQTLKQMKGVSYHQQVEVCKGVKATFLDAGHILGSAQIILDIDDGESTLRIAFTGDCGRKNIPILRDPDPLPECDVLLTESTYGDRLHPAREQMQEQVHQVLNDLWGKQGRILIPAFSVGRTQNILWYLGNLIDEGLLEPAPIYVDSPLSMKATTIVAKHRELFDEETIAAIDSGRSPFHFKGVNFVKDVVESKSLNNLRQGVIISASGMCEGGRILHHLERTVGQPQDTVLLVGFQAQGTLGRKLLEGYEYVKIYGERHRVRCKVRHIDGLSAHADYRELVEHLKPLAKTTKRVFVVHGEEDPARKLADRLEDAGFQNIEVPHFKEKFELA